MFRAMGASGRRIPEATVARLPEYLRLLTESLEAIDIDSLSRLEFIMRVESAYGVELDESKVNACRTIREFAALVTAASK